MNKLVDCQDLIYDLFGNNLAISDYVSLIQFYRNNGDYNKAFEIANAGIDIYIDNILSEKS